MRKIYISTLMFFEHLKEHKSRLYTFSPVPGVTSTYSVCYKYNDDMYCIIANDEQMMQYMVKKGLDVMKQHTAIEKTKAKREPKPKKQIFNFWK